MYCSLLFHQAGIQLKDQQKKPVNTIERLRMGKDVTIAALGDSFTRGWMVPSGFIDYFYQMLSEQYPDANIHIENAGIPGDTAEGGLHWVRRDVIVHKPHCVFVQFALNDAVTGYTPSTYGNFIRSIVRQVRKETGAEIVLITSNWLNGLPERDIADSFYREMENAGAELDIPVAKVHRYWEKKVQEGVSQKELVQFDGVHPTKKGHQLIAEALFHLFQ